MSELSTTFYILVTAGLTATIALPLGVMIGMSPEPTYQPSYYQTTNGTLQYCIPEGWTYAYSHGESHPRNAMTLNLGREICMQKGDEVNLTLQLTMTENGVEVG